MRQLSALDAQFLDFETVTNVANVAGLAILDRVIAREDLLVRLRARLHRVHQLRRRLVRVPLGLDRPYWAADAEVDLDYHVRELGLPAPGDDEELGALVARLHERRLDRDRPLWEMYLIHGLEGGRSAVYTKLHHAAVDGLTGADVLGALMDFEPDPGPEPEPAPAGEEEPPGAVRMLAQGLLHAVGGPVHTLRFLAYAVPRLDEIPLVSQLPGAAALSRFTRRLAGAPPLPELPRFTAPRTPLSGPVSAHRRFAFAELPLDEIKKVKNAMGVTVNDVVMALSASAVRRWLLARDALPEGPLVAGVPFSLRVEGVEGNGNQVTMMISPLPTHVADPVERLRETAAAMGRIKDRFRPAPAQWLREFTESLPAALNGLADRSAFALVGQTAPPINLIVSNVPGPQFPLYIAGARLLAHYPVSVITDVSGGMNITAFSYDGRLDVGIVGCREMVPDVWTLPGYLREALTELAEASKRDEPGKQGKRGKQGKPGGQGKPGRLSAGARDSVTAR
ncbi:WS/DGAT/MGAT family acyltransferase [Thermocatellispora tengchongensis]|uniref:Diacylglycerol O-acyltransferase n=1 Tax=Thermocatellispora tengchongensis TaxID=1073253 RepID=A0A840P7V9_9ACTN|nr:wax ester/triacylglycerol synthase family O-acyltransferase [Thermocatellispora tengchongensis]MBB5135758.1 WS/DGAT/MGAT family acyltransferase [Thermocatellispora tengchongensis]